MDQVKYNRQILKSNFISRDLSWLQFNYRVLDQARKKDRNIFDRMKFLAITSSNADEFFMIRIGSLYNYIDYDKERIDYSGLRAHSFRKKLLYEVKKFANSQNTCFTKEILPSLRKYGLRIISFKNLYKNEKEKVGDYFHKTIFPMLTPMMYDMYHTFPILSNNVLTFGVVTKSDNAKKMSFVQIPQNLPRFYQLSRHDQLLMLPIEEVIFRHIDDLFRNVKVDSVTLFRVTRNGDFTLEESEDIEANFLEELKQKIKERKTGRVVRLEVQRTYDPWLIDQLKERWEIDEFNIFEIYKSALLDYTALWEVINNKEFEEYQAPSKKPILPLSLIDRDKEESIFSVLKNRDVLLHHPYNSIEPLLELLEKSAEDPHVLSIKLTIYRLAKNSRVTNALHKAAENGKNVAVLFEVKARFDEENNLKEAQKLQKAGCYVIYGVGTLKTHTKLLLVVRKEENQVTRFVHMASGNYNEKTSRLYTDIGFITTRENYANDVSEFFNVITGHSKPEDYETLITAPRDMRDKLISLINQEAENAKKGLDAGIVFKINSLQDDKSINALYEASQAGVPVKLIVRGICCIRPGRKGLSDNITVRSIVGEYLEHSRLYYFHNNNEPKVYSGSADMMVRSFDRRLESLFLVPPGSLLKQVTAILAANLKDNVNAYEMREDGSYQIPITDGKSSYNIHRHFYKITMEEVKNAKIF